MIKRDYHTHSISPDANRSMEEMCRGALLKGIREIVFTDHYEFYEHGNGNGYFHEEYLNRYFREIEECEEKFRSRLLIKRGMEFGQLHLGGKRAADILESRPFDYIIGSVHKIHDVDLEKMDINEDNAWQIAREYYDTLLEVSEVGDFDCLGHLDYCKRHLRGAGCPDFYEDFEPVIRKILLNVIRRGKGIEVNTSGLRQPQKELTPALRTLVLYKELGGTIVTVGSDAHSPEYIGYEFCQAENALKQAGFYETAIYKHRKTLVFSI